MDDLLAAQTPTSGDISAHTVTGQGIAIGHGSHATVTHHHYAALAPASERERRNRTVMLQKVTPSGSQVSWRTHCIQQH